MIAIKDMEMPKNCASCVMKVGGCKERIYIENRPDRCPLTEIKTDVDTISRQAAIDAIMGQPPEPHYPSWYAEQIKALPSAQQQYEPVTAEDFAKTMSENSLYNFVAWHQEALTLMKEHGFVICKKTM